jgi:ADP-L-glycero-D-manno-heptose 6-epimerase
MQKPIVVTGGAGFIGSNIVAALNERGQDDVLIVEQLGTDDKWKNLRGLRYLDVIDKDQYIADVRQGRATTPRAIIHMGACSATTERNADYLLANNYHYSRTLAEWALQIGARYIGASSAATYGDGARGYSDSDAVTPTLRPLNMYGYSKQMFDEWALRHGYYRQLVGLKFFNVFGPGENHKGDMRSVVNKAYREVLTSGTISLFRSTHPDYADGCQKRDFVYVKDAVAVVLFLLDRPEINGLFNCGTGEARTWLDLAHAVFTAMGREPRINWIQMPESLALKYQNYTKADPAKLRAAGFNQPFLPLEAAVADYIRHLAAETD